MIHHKNARKGFTLIEILVVIAIIAILASVVLIGLGPAQQAARDSKRISDLRQIQNALELFHLTCGVYPGGNSPNATACGGSGGVGGTVTVASMSGLLTAAGITQTMPDDPLGANLYQYTPSTATPGSGYTLSAKLEEANNSALGPAASPNGISCGQGTGVYCLTL